MDAPLFRILYEERFSAKDINQELVNHCDDCLQHASYDSGQFESLGYDVGNIRQAFGRLMAIMFSRNLISADEVQYIINDETRTTTQIVPYNS